MVAPLESAALQNAEAPTAAGQAPRQRRLALLARAPRERLEAAHAACGVAGAYDCLKPAETGLALLRARAGGKGQRFNAGEVTVTRCVVTLKANGALGVAYIAGRDRRKAELAAALDALSQLPGHAEKLEASLFQPLEQELNEQRALRAAKVAATRVDFFTLVRGGD